MVKFNRIQRINVYAGTIEDIKTGYYVDQDRVAHDFNLDGVSRDTRFFQKVKPVTDSARFDTVIYTQLIDCIQKAYEFGDSGALLNMASRFKAGGGVLNGSGSQEEEIFRRTTLGYSLYYYDPAVEVYEYPNRTNGFSAYPIMGDRAAFWSPGIMIYRKGPSGHYDYLVAPKTTNVISVPGVQHPELTEEGTEFKGTHRKMWINKIRTVLRVALQYNKRKLVLGAWGCGAYGNPAPLVARLFKEVLGEPEFDGHFEEICFAVIEDKNSGKGGNYAPFAEVFGHK